MIEAIVPDAIKRSEVQILVSRIQLGEPTVNAMGFGEPQLKPQLVVKVEIF